MSESTPTSLGGQLGRLGRHSLIYGIGGLVSRIVAVLLLTVYTHYLTPADYGKIETLIALTEMALMVYKALGIDLQATTMERIVRVTSALSGLGASAMVAAHVGLQREWRGPIVEAAMDALGHAGKPKRPARKRA